ncbi:hypothetical protein WKK05_24735 [Nostoc sp. UHCC 0302]|uniref:hypothetical protein n=1 Tax=Nostoc sp. UHCC 0302 TaxID=3134896 RepID=UPI00311CB3D1
MAKQSKKNLEASHDVRVVATTRIWGLTVGILAICIPLSVATRSGAVLPLVAIGGATVGTVAVWRSNEEKSQTPYLQQQQVELLEQRIANLETIISSHDFELQMKLQQLEASDTLGKPSGIDNTLKRQKHKA